MRSPALHESRHETLAEDRAITPPAGNARAAAIYRKLGFVEEGVKRRSVCLDGAFVDEIMMARLQG